ncbi:MAG: secretin N-terminal domain-containing protein [Planctomycetaceae bacterium]
MLATWITAQLLAPVAAADPIVPAPGFIRLGEKSAQAAEDKTPAEPAPKVRLNVFNETWPRILEKVAEQSGSTLILQDKPPGRLTRADHRTYSRTEAVEILNRELASQGFRILENDEFLIVLHERTMRKHYRPPVVAPEDEHGRPVPNATSPEPVHQGYRRQFDTIVPAGAESEPRQANGAESGVRPLTPPHPFEQPVGQTPARPVSKPAEVGPPVTVSVRVERGSAAVVAKRVHDAFGTRSRLADAGPSGLPSFRVQSLDAAGAAEDARTVAFEVEIDTAQNELLVTAPRKCATAVAELLRDVDQVAGDPNQLIRIEPASDGQMRLGTQLDTVLAQINEGQGGQNQPNQPMSQPGRNGQDGQPGQNGDDEREQRPGVGSDLPALMANLRGEVSVEAVEDLGVLIIRGNDQDVQAVLEVIRTLENLSAGQQPVIELLKLEHVDSTALSTLLEEVYGRLATIRNRGEETPSRVAIFPIVKPNAVLIIAPEGEVDSVLDLATELDQPVDPTTEFQVFRLRSAVASQAAELVEQFYEERAGLGARGTVIADIRTNSLIVSARPRDLEEIAALVRKIDSDESAWVNRLKVYPLQSAAAEELAEVINAAIQSVINPTAAQQPGQGGIGGGVGGAGGEEAQELRTARSAVLEFLDATGDAPQLIRSGLLADIRITADPRTNSLLVTAGEQSLPLVEAMIRALDRPSSAVSEIKVFSLQNSDATSVIELLESLFSTEDQGDEDTPFGVQLAGATDAGSSLIPIRFGVDVRTNSVIATGSADALRIVEAILLRLDESDVRNRETTVVKLKNAYAPDVALALQNLLTSQRELITISEDLVSNIELLEREIIVVPEAASNSLIISATPQYFDEVRRIVAKLDEAPPQVIIQAMLVEVVLDNTDEFGIELGLQDSTLFDRSLTTIDQLLETTTTSPNGVQTTSQQIISQSGTPGFDFNNTQGPLGNNTAVGPGSVGTQGVSNFSLGRANADLGYGGFVFSASSANVSVLLRALSAKRTVQVLSRPQIRTLDNQLATIQVGQNVPVIDGVTFTGLQASPNISRDDAGLILQVAPRISPDGSVVMEVAAERSEYTGAGVPVFVNATTGDTIEAPIKDITTARATVSVPTGQTIVLGGIITRSDETLERKVPYLGDIPYLGQLFRFDSTRTQRRELLVFLTPRVIYNDADSELIKQVEADRLHFIEQEAEAMHGPLYAVPPADPITPPGGVPPVIGPNRMPSHDFVPSDRLPPDAEVLPGLPAEECPPGVYPPGTLFDGTPPAPSLMPPPGYPPSPYGPPGSVPMRPGAPDDLPPQAPPADGGVSDFQPIGAAYASGRLAGRVRTTAHAEEKKSLLPRFRK